MPEGVNHDEKGGELEEQLAGDELLHPVWHGGSGAHDRIAGLREVVGEGMTEEGGEGGFIHEALGVDEERDGDVQAKVHEHHHVEGRAEDGTMEGV